MEIRLGAGEVALVHSIGTCNFCPNQAAYDGRIKGHGSWAYFCEDCWTTRGVGIVGLGYGQRLIRVVSNDKPIEVGSAANWHEYLVAPPTIDPVGCKIYRHDVTGELALAHNSTYGCTR